MPFEFRDSMINDYWSQGFVIFRRILPPSLLRDLRPEADKARVLARELLGPQAQRLMPVARHAGRINLKPFQDYNELPILRDAIHKLLGPTSGGARVVHTNPKHLGILVEPAARPRHHSWHRDVVCDVPLADQTKPERLKFITEHWNKKTISNQVNCAIYPDPCLWYVPGSHARQIDLPGETQGWCYFTQKSPLDAMEGSHAELEAAYLEHAYGFPGAVRVYLDAGDFLVYRNLGWHTGVYTTHTPRATIHDDITYHWPDGSWT
jgi:hypothetical protein